MKRYTFLTLFAASFLLLSACQTTNTATPESDAMMKDDAMMEDDKMMKEDAMMKEDGEAMMEKEDAMMEKDGEAMMMKGEVKSFEMVAKRWEFSPDTITVKQGDKVELSITSEDVDHGFRLDDFGVSETLAAGETTKVSFTADKKGTFSFSCNVFCGSGHDDMKGTLVVE